MKWKDIKNTIENYFSVTTIHGFQYVQRGNSKIIKILWTIIILVGFFLAANIINSAILDWRSNPVITSLDSIATPIDEIQFPTLTVCDDKANEVHDNWAFIESTFNFLEDYCYSPSDSIEYGRYCNVTDHLRKDFNFLIESIVDAFLTPLLSNKNLNQSLHFLSSYETQKGAAFAKLLKKANDVVSSGNMTLEDIEKLPVDYFNKELSNRGAFEYIFEGKGFDTFPPFDTNDCDSVEECIKIEVVLEVITLLNKLYEFDNGFGTLLRNFIRLSNFDSFSFSKELLHIYINEVLFGKLEKICENLKPHEKQLHGTLANISQVVAGFQVNELMSAYDIPGILSDVTSEDELSVGSLPKSFFHSRCQYGFENKDLRKCFYKWKKYVYGSGEHPCKDDMKEDMCCLFWTKKMGNNLEAMMKVMRFANRRGRPKYDLYSIVSNGTTKILQYTLKDMREKGKSSKFDLTSIIPMCFFQEMDEDTYHKEIYSESSCQHFQPVITDKGMCQAFNALPVSNIIIPSYFTESFNNAYQHDLINDGMLHMGRQSGDSFIFYLLGNYRARVTQHGKGLFNEEMGPSVFMLGISNANEYFDLQASRKIIPAGNRLTISIRSMEVVPTKGMKDVSIESRKCRLPEENQDLKIFKSYSKAACEFEFRLFKAQETCQCVPWDMPWHSNERYPICDIYGNYCFKAIWKKHLKGITQCLPGCYQLKFSSSEVGEKLNAEEICIDVHNSVSGIGQVAKTLWEKSGMPLFNTVKKLKDLSTIGNWNKTTYNGTEEMIKFCNMMVENDLAEVIVKFERPEFIRSSTSKRVSFPDQLGVFGGTLGLFTGMSILSMVEILHWLVKFIFKAFEGCSHMKKTNTVHAI